MINKFTLTLATLGLFVLYFNTEVRPLPEFSCFQNGERSDSRDDCAWYGGDCGSGEKCSDECYEKSEN